MSPASAEIDLTGRVAVVTGAARGMGAEHAAAFVAAGARVVLSDVSPDVLDVAASLGPDTTAVCGDVSTPGHWADVVAAAEGRFGPPGVLVNNAGRYRSALIEDLSFEDYARTVAVNQFSVFLGTRAVWPGMRRAGGGSIVNISSIAGVRGDAGEWAYSSSKFAVRGLTQCGAVEGAPHGIRVNSVHPGSIRTPLVADVPAHEVEEFLRRVPLGRMGEPSEVSAIVLFLASDAASYVTGAEFVVDGGALVG